MMKHMAHPAVAMHHVLAISSAFAHSLIGFVLLFGQAISSSMIWIPTTGRRQSQTLYEIAIRTAHGDEDVMANYLLVVINQSMN
jgi:hypothetical protein